MKEFYRRPKIGDATLEDRFWSPYVENFQNITIPYCFEKFYETKYIQNFVDAAENNQNKHVSFPFSDGLVLETITGASNFLKTNYDKQLDQKLDEIIEIIVAAQQSDGYLCTMTTQDYPDKRWGENGGDIVLQHDVYNHGTLIEAGIAHYNATGKTTLLIPAIKAANLMCSHIGEAPKHHVIPGHSLTELAFMDLYRLFKENRELDIIAKQYSVNIDEYLEIVRFWYDNRGIEKRRTLKEISDFAPERYQNTMPFGKMRSAMGHAVRAGLCYAGAASAYRELLREDYKEALFAIWNDVTKKKIHISGGVGARADIEGFDMEYSLKNDAYLETCAGIALAFWASEMSLFDKNSKYFDIFELSLYNNILGSMGKDFKKFYYDNPLINDGTKNRWDWHSCPCCPPMLSKIYSSLASYIYSYNSSEICINMYIDSHFKTDDFEISQHNKTICVKTTDDGFKLNLRIPSYADVFSLIVDGKTFDFISENGYAVINLKKGANTITANFNEKICEICANTNVESDKGKVCFMKGTILYCAEGIDNGGDTDFIIAEYTDLIICDDNIKVKTKNGDYALLMPYYKRNNRVNENQSDSKMAVWFEKENCKSTEEIEKITGDNLYGYYKKHLKKLG